MEQTGVLKQMPKMLRRPISIPGRTISGRTPTEFRTPVDVPGVVPLERSTRPLEVYPGTKPGNMPSDPTSVISDFLIKLYGNPKASPSPGRSVPSGPPRSMGPIPKEIPPTPPSSESAAVDNLLKELFNNMEGP